MPDPQALETFLRSKLTRDEVNRVIKQYLSAKNLHVVFVTKDAAGLRDRLLAGTPSSIKYDAPKPELAAEDKTIGSLPLGLKADQVRVVPAGEVFVR